MASVGTSPLSGYEFPTTADSITDDDEALWATLSSGSAAGYSPGPAYNMPSPSNNSLGSSWAVLGPRAGFAMTPPPVAGSASPQSHLDLFDLQQQHHQQQANSLYASAAAVAAATNSTASPATLDLDGQQLLAQSLAQADFPLFDDIFNQAITTEAAREGIVVPMPLDLDFMFSPYAIDPLPSQQQGQSQPQLQQSEVPLVFDINAPPWEPPNLRATAAPGIQQAQQQPRQQQQQQPMFVLEDSSFPPASPPQAYSYSPSVATPESSIPRSPEVTVKREVSPKHQLSASSTTTAAQPITIRRTNTSNRVTKKKTAASSVAASASSSISLSGGSSGASQSKFLIVTPTSIQTHTNNNRPNPFECFEMLRPSQRGRKGPLASDTKESALQVRRKGACFCCHARKVKCNMERPCLNCKKLTCNLPGVVCWVFGDFIGVLFPEFIRGHLTRDEVSKFVRSAVASFFDGTPLSAASDSRDLGELGGQHAVSLYSGSGFSSVLTVSAKFFRPRADNAEALQHWHMTVTGNGKMALQARNAATLAIDMAETGRDAQRDELRRRLREYTAGLVDEPAFAELVTADIRHTQVPARVLRIVQDYYVASGNPIVRRALTVYAMHFVMTRHLCLTPSSLATLSPILLFLASQDTNEPPPQLGPYVTPRVLNRQIKAALDDLLTREVQLLFEMFSKSLKPKQKREWAPCLAAFLVLCLFMESVETAADRFVISDTEVLLRSANNTTQPRWKRSFALGINREIEGMPFRQFALQFHHLYQTHAGMGAAFNPIGDYAFRKDATSKEGMADLGDDEAAERMVERLAGFVSDDDDWHELDYLTVEPMFGNVDDHPFPGDVAYNYSGRLVAKFLLSFVDLRYLEGK